MENRQSPPPETPAPFPYTNVHRLLLAGALLIGIFFRRMFSIEADTIRQASLLYSLFWALYLAVFLAFSWKRAVQNRDGWLLVCAFLVLAARGAFYAQQQLFFINIFVIPCLLMLHAAVVNLALPKGKEAWYAVAFFKGWFVWPFSAIGRFWGAVASLFRTGRNSGARKTLYGVLIAVPLLAVVGALLLNADSVMSFYFSDFFRNLNLGSIAGNTAVILIAAMLFYSFLFNAVWNRSLPKTDRVENAVPSLTLSVAVGALLIAYAAFAYVQFAYLMGFRGLPAELTYSEYARRGFSELIWVSLINLAVFSFCLCRGEQTKLLRALLVGLLAATLILLYSAAFRLCLYIGAYGLTFMRLLPLWFMAFLLFALLMCAVRLVRKKFPLLRAAAMGLLIWYLLLNVVNADGLIAGSILRKAEREGALSGQDYNYIMYTLSSDADPVRREYRELLRAAALSE